MRTIFWALGLVHLAACLWLLTVLALLSTVSTIMPGWIGYASAPFLFACGSLFMQMVTDPPSVWPRRI